LSSFKLCIVVKQIFIPELALPIIMPEKICATISWFGSPKATTALVPKAAEIFCPSGVLIDH